MQASEIEISNNKQNSFATTLVNRTVHRQQDENNQQRAALTLPDGFAGENGCH